MRFSMKDVLTFSCALALVTAPPAMAQTTFDHDHAAPITAVGVAGDLLTEGTPFPAAPVVAIGAGAIGLVAGDEIDALSFGDDVAIAGFHVLVFSVDPAAVGVLGTGVDFEVTADTPLGAFPAACGDLFIQAPGNTNALSPAGLGYRTGTLTGDEHNARWGSPNPIAGPADDLDAFDFSPPVADPINGIFFSLAPGSPTLAAIPATAGDILWSPLGGGPVIIAVLAGDGAATDVNLGITGENLNALNVIGSNIAGVGTITAGGVGAGPASGGAPGSTHLVEYSIAGGGGVSPSDVLIRTGAGTFGVHTPSIGVGLVFSDDLNALEAVPPPVPAVSEWGMIVMILLALTAGTVVFARWRRPAAA